MFDYSPSELQRIDEVLEPKLAWGLDRQVQCEQMALDASRLLSCVEDRLEDYASHGFFRRCWSTLSGKNGAVERANAGDLTDMQKHAWRYINLLQERDLLLAHSVIAVKNNLLTLAVQHNDMRGEITRLAGRVYDRFVALENRVDRIEVASSMHSWLLTIETRDYDERYAPQLRLLRVVGDFHALKGDSWTADELRYLQKALRDVGLSPKQTLTVSDFVNGLIDDIEAQGFDAFATLTETDRGQPIDHGFVVDAVSAPAFGALYQVKDNYTVSSRVIRALQKRLEISHADAMKATLHDFVTEHGIDTEASIPLRDLAVELLGCMSLAQRLAHALPGAGRMETGTYTGSKAERNGIGAGDATRVTDRSMCDAGSPGGKAEPASEKCRDQSAASEKYSKIIANRLKEYQHGALYVCDVIPKTKEKNARIGFPIDDNAIIYGLIDCTIFGKCDEGMAVCNNGIYWKNGNSKTEKNFASWSELIANKDSIATNNGMVVLGKSGHFNPASSNLAAKYVVMMIIDIVEQLRAG
jgi:hypothetical protein